MSVPRLYNRIYDKIVGGAAAKGYVASTLFSKGLAAKARGAPPPRLRRVPTGPTPPPWPLD